VVNIGRAVVDDDVVVGTEVPPVGQHPCVASKQGVHRDIGGTVQGTWEVGQHPCVAIGQGIHAATDGSTHGTKVEALVVWACPVGWNVKVSLSVVTVVGPVRPVGTGIVSLPPIISTPELETSV
jgi:hypothetical protein